jgi:branched-chain amino acid transport system permease protein
MGQLIISGVLVGGIYALMSIGLTLIFGVLRIVNFAHGEFLMIATYGAWAITRVLGLNPLSPPLRSFRRCFCSVRSCTG